MIEESVLFLQRNMYRLPFHRNVRMEDFPGREPGRLRPQWSLFPRYVNREVPGEVVAVQRKPCCPANGLRRKPPSCVSVGYVQRYFPEVGIPVSCSADGGKGLRISDGRSRVETPSGLLFYVREDFPTRISYLKSIVSSSWRNSFVMWVLNLKKL